MESIELPEYWSNNNRIETKTRSKKEREREIKKEHDA
jgi:hypothetical protein